jgi:hypothetical protein
VEEHQVNAIPSVPNSQPLLTSDKSEVIAQFEQEVLEMENQGLF